jgi:uncharacterized protein (DUF1499 family)
MNQNSKKLSLESIVSVISNSPSSPNYVSSMATDKDQFLTPWKFNSSLKETKEKLHQIISKMDRSKIVQNHERFIYAVFTSKFFRFKDDLYIYFDTDKQLIHFKSQSRLGHSDLGVNKKRILSIKEKFLK